MHRGDWWFLIAIAGCAPATGGNLEADRAAVRALVEAEVRAGNNGDPEAFLAVFADEAVVMPPNGPMVAGAAFRQWVRDFFRQATVNLTGYQDEELIVAGDWAIHRYSFRWTVTPKAGGEPVSEPGKGFHIARREPDGSWKLTHDIWNSDTSPRGM